MDHYLIQDPRARSLEFNLPLGAWACVVEHGFGADLGVMLEELEHKSLLGLDITDGSTGLEITCMVEIRGIAGWE